MAPWLLLRDARGGWLGFDNPRQIHSTHHLDAVIPTLEAVEAAVEAGAWAAGFLAYEAAPAFDAALVAHPPGDQPLTWWGLFDPPRHIPGEAVPQRLHPGVDPAAQGIDPTAPPPDRLDWRPTVDRAGFHRAIDAIHRRIARGETYQINYTFPLETHFEGDPYALFRQLMASQPEARYAGYLDLGDLAIASASPELFLEGDGHHLRARPMKGTARRGRYPAEDAAAAEGLVGSPKDRAENVMIVDMVRNDLGRIATPGSVRTEALFTLETHPTVHQLTSTVVAESAASWVDVLRATFPSASITGAPKVATSRWIRELEPHRRGVYTGSLGFLAPPTSAGRPGRFQLNVAIRTAVLDRRTSTAVYGVGSGVVWDSRADAEYDECRAKALVLAAPAPDFALFETLLWRRRSGFFLRRRHVERLLASARALGFAVESKAIETALDDGAATLATTPRARARLRLTRDGDVGFESWDFPCEGRRPWRLALDDRPVDSQDPLLFHKTTRRQLYETALERARERQPAIDEVLLWNERGELTEGCRTNVVVRRGDQWLTPPLHCGLLPGTYRAALLERGRLHEEVLRPKDLEDCDGVFLVNSLRGWIATTPGISGLAKTPSEEGSKPFVGQSATEGETSIQSFDPKWRSSSHR